MVEGLGEEPPTLSNLIEAGEDSFLVKTHPLTNFMGLGVSTMCSLRPCLTPQLGTDRILHETLERYKKGCHDGRESPCRTTDQYVD